MKTSSFAVLFDRLLILLLVFLLFEVVVPIEVYFFIVHFDVLVNVDCGSERNDSEDKSVCAKIWKKRRKRHEEKKNEKMKLRKKKLKTFEAVLNLLFF